MAPKSLNLHGVTYKRAKLTLLEALRLSTQESVNYQDKETLLKWLRQKGFDSLAVRVESLSDAKFRIALEDFKRKSLQSGGNTPTKLTTLDKPPVYEYTNTNDSTIFDSGPGAPMRDTTDQKFLDRARSLLKPSG